MSDSEPAAKETQQALRLGEHQMHPQTVEVASLAGDVAAKGLGAMLFQRTKSATADTDVVAHGYRQGGHRVAPIGVVLLEDLFKLPTQDSLEDANYFPYRQDAPPKSTLFDLQV